MHRDSRAGLASSHVCPPHSVAVTIGWGDQTAIQTQSSPIRDKPRGGALAPPPDRCERNRVHATTKVTRSQSYGFMTVRYEVAGESPLSRLQARRRYVADWMTTVQADQPGASTAVRYVPPTRRRGLPDRLPRRNGWGSARRARAAEPAGSMGGQSGYLAWFGWSPRAGTRESQAR